MPIKCSNGQKPRYRWIIQGGKKVRLAFCGNKVVERKVRGGKAKKITPKKRKND